MSNNRDTKFQSFAKALIEELKEADAFTPTTHLEIALKRIEPIIARRAHDLVKHTIIDLRHDDERYADDWAQKVSDMTWPLEDNKNE